MQPHLPLLRASLRLDPHREDAYDRLGPCLDVDELDEGRLMRSVHCCPALSVQQSLVKRLRSFAQCLTLENECSLKGAISLRAELS